jgi:hypothetical protein
MGRLQAVAVALAVSALALPASPAAASRSCGYVKPTVPKGSGGGIPSRLRTRAVKGSSPCGEVRSIFTRYYVTRLTWVGRPEGYTRILDGYRCNGGVEPRALIVCKRSGALLEAEKG